MAAAAVGEGDRCAVSGEQEAVSGKRKAEGSRQKTDLSFTTARIGL